MKANSWNEGCIGMQRKASVRSSTVSYLSFPGIWTNIRIGHQGMCKDHCIIYCSKVLYRLILPICLNNWQNRGIAGRQGIKRPCVKNLSMKAANPFCFQLYGILSLVRISDFCLKANFYRLGIYSLPRDSFVSNCGVYCV